MRDVEKAERSLTTMMMMMTMRATGDFSGLSASLLTKTRLILGNNDANSTYLLLAI